MATSKLAVSFSSRSGVSYDKQLDKITNKELNSLLNEKIDLSYAHIQDDVKHITAEERNRWNTILDGIKPATEQVAGLMSVEDKFKLDKIDNFANNYKHPTSGVNAGSYIRVTVNEHGHVIYGDNPNRLNVNVDNAEKLGGMLPSYYAKADSPTFTGIVKVPDVTIGGNANSPVTIKLLEDYVAKQILNKAYPVGSVYITLTNTNPSETIGGQWKRVAEGRCLVGVSAERDITLRKTGGSITTTINENNLPPHTHHIDIIATTSTDGNHNHDSGWGEADKRTARYGIRPDPTNSNIHNKFGQGSNNDWDNFAYLTSTDGAHNHTVNINGNITSTTANTPLNVENPYLGVYMWERIS
jgi:hypothetical protein